MKWLKRGIILALWFVSIVYVYGFGALAGKFAPHLTEQSMARSAKVLALFTGGYTPCNGRNVLQCGFQDTSGRTEVSCADYLPSGEDNERKAVLMTFGQSNSANAGNDRYLPLHDVANFNIHDGKCYAAEDPLLGPDGSGGSVWGVLADKLIMSDQFDKVLLVPFGIGGSSVTEWQNGALLHPILKRATKALAEQNIQPTHVLWHQGESDAQSDISEDEYVSLFDAMLTELRDEGIKAPMYPAIATHCNMKYLEKEPNEAGIQRVRAAQARLVELEGVRAGPDTDVIQGELLRHDNCHMNAKGIKKHAELWLNAITKTPTNSE